MYSLDFETKAIVFGSGIPPEPVGCAIETPDLQRKYWSWGHPTNNNCTKEEFVAYLHTIWHEEMVGHNILGFDLEVAYYWLGMPERDPLLTWDTNFEAYLIDPHAKSIRLKDLAVDWLGIPADERDELYDWIMANVPECRSRKNCGEFICRAPGDIAGRYAEADVYMARALHEYCLPKILEMMCAVDRERALAPILAKIKRGGIRIDEARLRADYRIAMAKLSKLDTMIRQKLNQPNLNPGSDKEVVAALKGAGYTGFLTTPTGRDSASKESLEAVLASDPDLQSMLRSRATYATLTGTFMGPWLAFMEMNNGYICPQYNQVRSVEGYGTRTGRLSSDHPNGQNIPDDQGIDYFGDPFPNMREYCLPDEGMVWYSIDFKAQEPRLTAHFEDGRFMEAFNEDPDMDPYIFVKDLVGGDITRHDAKQILLGIIYAMGAAAMAERVGCDIGRANLLRNAIRSALPDVNELDKDCKKRFRLGLPIRTIGGRLCYCEPPSNGRTWEYKALNLLIQGSAADQTKEAIIYADEHLAEAPFPSRLLGTVHDEINLCAPPGLDQVIYDLFTEAANALPCDVPMRITLGVGKTWGEAAK